MAEEDDDGLDGGAALDLSPKPVEHQLKGYKFSKLPRFIEQEEATVTEQLLLSPKEVREKMPTFDMSKQRPRWEDAVADFEDEVQSNFEESTVPAEKISGLAFSTVPRFENNNVEEDGRSVLSPHRANDYLRKKKSSGVSLDKQPARWQEPKVDSAATHVEYDVERGLAVLEKRLTGINDFAKAPSRFQAAAVDNNPEQLILSPKDEVQSKRSSVSTTVDMRKARARWQNVNDLEKETNWRHALRSPTVGDSDALSHNRTSGPNGRRKNAKKGGTRSRENGA